MKNYELFVGSVDAVQCAKVALIDPETKLTVIKGIWNPLKAVLEINGMRFSSIRLTVDVQHYLMQMLEQSQSDVVQITSVNLKDFGAVPDSKSALATQVGGSHYKDMPIQPAEYCHRNGIGKLEGDVIAYVSRWRKKNGIEDLKKARHTIDIILELEGGETHHG